MKKSEMTAIITCILLIATIISGCFPNGPQKNMSDTETSTSTSGKTDLNYENSAPLYGTTEKLTRDMIPDRYEEKIADSLLISADVHIPDDISFGTVEAEKVKLPDESQRNEIVSLFIDEQNGIERDENEQEQFYKYIDAGKKEVIIDTVSINYDRDGTDIDIEQAISDPDYFEYTMFYRYSMTYTPRLADYYKQTELDGIDREESVAKVREKVEKLNAMLGTQSVKEPEVYCLDSDSAHAFAEGTGLYSDDAPKLPKDSEAYYILFRAGFDGLTVGAENSNGGIGYEQPYAYGIVDKNGLVEFRMNWGYIQLGEKIEPSGMYNVGVVKKALDDEYADIMPKLSKLKVVSDIYLEYVCKNAPDNTGKTPIFEPYWICYVCELEGDTLPEDSSILPNPSMVLRINALTGELMRTSDVQSVKI